MAHFQILKEVRTGNSGDWQLCFQFGIYEYDPEQDTVAPREAGYRFIWRRKNGDVGARIFRAVDAALETARHRSQTRRRC